jgi:hypothetical protein
LSDSSSVGILAVVVLGVVLELFGVVILVVGFLDVVVRNVYPDVVLELLGALFVVGFLVVLVVVRFVEVVGRAGGSKELMSILKMTSASPSVDGSIIDSPVLAVTLPGYNISSQIMHVKNEKVKRQENYTCANCSFVEYSSLDFR